MEKNKIDEILAVRETYKVNIDQIIEENFRLLNELQKLKNKFKDSGGGKTEPKKIQEKSFEKLNNSQKKQ